MAAEQIGVMKITRLSIQQEVYKPTKATERNIEKLRLYFNKNSHLGLPRNSR